MIKAVIIDDEQHNISNLKSLLEKHCPEINIAATALNAEEGEKIILKNYPDLVFLDIQMPRKNGFELLQSLHAYTLDVIFVTAYDQFGIQAVKFAAIDYLLKPINVEELKLSVKKVIEKNNQRKQNGQLENLIALLRQNQNQDEQRIALPTTKEIRFVKPGDILRCESSNNYTTFYLSNNEKLLISKPIYLYEELLNDYGFIRCHQSHLVNKKYIQSYVKEDGGYIMLHDKTRLPIAKNKKELIKQLFSHKAL